MISNVEILSMPQKKNVINKKLIQQNKKNILQCHCWKSVALLYINDQSEKEIKKTVLFTIVSGRINYLMINWTKKSEDLHSEMSNFVKILNDTNPVFMHWKTYC